jgi:hypothetical protein
MTNPYPIAVSFDSNTDTSRPRRVSRAMIPAANPPSSRSSPSFAASATSAKMSTTARRTASWLLDSSVRSSACQPSGSDLTATSAAATARVMNATRMTALFRLPPVERTSVISSSGPNSPTAPAPRR